MKKILKRIVKICLSLVLILALTAGIYFLSYKATVSFDFSEKTGKVKKGASGCLYGIAENGVPSSDMVESLDIQTIAQKISGGLQHPIGDIDNADPLLKDIKYEVVYLQDVYDTWYYLDDYIMEERSKGSYDWQKLLDEDFFPKVKSTVEKMSKNTYSSSIVYCLYNECDNGLWFGESIKDDNPDNTYGVWCSYNEKGRDNFNSAWKQCYELVKEIDKDSLIGGPGFCDFDADEIRYFLSFCKENDCLPDIMIYHELAEREAYYFDDHIREYRAIEKEVGIGEIEIIITEYGMMSENGYPGEMVKYVSQFENNKVYGDTAYWRLSNNLNDNCADDNSPNAQWWLMRWYTDMQGNTVKGRNLDILSSDFKNYFKYHHDELSFNGFTAIASLSEKEDEIDIVCGGGNKKSKIELKNLDSTALYGKDVVITVEETVYKGLYGIVSKPIVIDSYSQKLGKKASIDIGKVDAANAYHITIRPADSCQISEKDERAVRYEFEDGTLLGDAYLYDSYCPASGGDNEGRDMVGGMEKPGDGVEIEIGTGNGDYILDFVYGKANDSSPDENGKLNPDDRVPAQVILEIDGDEQIISLPNTIKSEYTSCYSLTLTGLKKGKHKIKLTHKEGTYVLDSLLLTAAPNDNNIIVLRDTDRSNESTKSFLMIAPYDGYYILNADAEKAYIDSAEISFINASATVYLKRGLNFIDIRSDKDIYLKAQADTREIQPEERIKYTPDMLTLTKPAKAEDGYIDNISCLGGEAELIYKASKSGIYRITVEYSNNDEGGVHDYNVDLIERYITISVNSEEPVNVFCRNTYSWETKKTVTFSLNLKEGENIIKIYNDGSSRFNNQDTFAPRIYSLTLSPAQIYI